jgi:hypothetical protein
MKIMKFLKMVHFFIFFQLKARIKNFVRITKQYKPFGIVLDLDVCPIVAGAKHPLIQTFMPPDMYDQLNQVVHPCPYGVR